MLVLTLIFISSLLSIIQNDFTIPTKAKKVTYKYNSKAQKMFYHETTQKKSFFLFYKQ